MKNIKKISYLQYLYVRFYWATRTARIDLGRLWPVSNQQVFERELDPKGERPFSIKSISVFPLQSFPQK